MTGISRRLPDTERHRLKSILKKIVPEDAGVIVRTAAEGASEEDLTRDVERLQAAVGVDREEGREDHVRADARARRARPRDPRRPRRVQRGLQAARRAGRRRLEDRLDDYVEGVAPDLAERVSKHTGDSDLFHDLRVDEQLMKALDRKVWLPSGGSLVIDRTEAMTVIDVNTGKFVGSGGNLEQTVTRNNLEAAEEIVRQLRLRDVGGIVVIDFIDMVLESNRELVLRRLTECLGRDRTKHQVAEVTSLGLVQMTRKRVGEGLLEAFSETCEVCHGRGVIVHPEPVEKSVVGSCRRRRAEEVDRAAQAWRQARRGGRPGRTAGQSRAAHQGAGGDDRDPPGSASRRRASRRRRGGRCRRTRTRGGHGRAVGLRFRPRRAHGQGRAQLRSRERRRYRNGRAGSCPDADRDSDRGSQRERERCAQRSGCNTVASAAPAPVGIAAGRAAERGLLTGLSLRRRRPRPR